MRPLHSERHLGIPKACKFEKDEIAKMRKLKVIEPAQTKWVTIIVFPQKSDRTLWFLIDYRNLNEVAVHDSYPTPLYGEVRRCIERCEDFLDPGQEKRLLASRNCQRK